MSLTLIFAILYTNILENNLGNILAKEKIQKRIWEQEDLFDLFQSAFSDKIKKQKDSFVFSDRDIRELQQNHINFFVYQKNELLSWSDNEAIPKAESIRRDNEVQLAKLSDGYYILKAYKLGDYKLIASFLIAHDYPFENEYLTNELNPVFGLSKSVVLHFEGAGEEEYSILNKAQNILFRISFPKTQITGPEQSIILFIIYMLLLALTLNFLYILLRRKLKKQALFFMYAAIVIAIRLVLQYLRMPDVLFETDIFSPGSYAVSQWFPSLGDLFLSVYTLFVIVLAASNMDVSEWIKIERLKTNKFIAIISGTILLLGTLLLFYAGMNVIHNLIINSSIHFDIADFFELNHLSFIGLLVIAQLVFIILFLLYAISALYSAILSRKTLRYSLAFIVLSLGGLYFFLEMPYRTVLFVLLVMIMIYSNKRKNRYSLQKLIPVLLLISLITAISMNEYNHEAEKLRRKAIVRSVAINQDPQVEYLFRKIEKKIYRDTMLIQAFHDNNVSFDSITQYIFKTYFEPESHWKKYDLQATICDEEQELVIKPENIRILCNDFFFRNLISFGTLTKNKNLYHLNYGTGQINYLGLLRFVEHTMQGDVIYTIYLEINSKLKRKGFTKLLSEKGNDPFEKIRNYSLAAYDKGVLVESYGQYSYPELTEPYMKSTEEMFFVDHNGYNHLVYRNNERELYILSKKIPEKLTTIAPFSYLFILFGLLFIAGALLYNHSLTEWHLELNFTTRLQFSMIAIIIVSFAIISYFSAHYIVRLNNEKNNQRLKYLSTSLQMEFEHKVSDIDVPDTENNADYLQTLSMKFSKVFDTDINLYDLQGNLITGTRPEIFEQHLLSNKMNPLAYYKLSHEKESFLVTQENIGSLVYSSAFLPFHNNQREVVAYLNLPYFARQSEMQSEVSNFLMTLMNVYTFIIVLSIIVILLISNYISRPLRMIKEKLQKLSLSSTNEKIEWKGKDEIGKLVDEYNRMAEQLSIKVDLLAKSERESAWREMAKQVAHEIKNPLTPMKLSVQYLLKSWNEKDPDWEERLQRLSETLIQQIDTLSDIATAFSDFAKMPKSNNEKINLDEIIQNAIELYADYDNLQINFTYSEDHKFFVYADRKHLLRVFNNLIKNAIQSFEIGQNGFIDIDIEEHLTAYRINIRDNGCGIPEDKKQMIFVPNFTTKSKGTGLGLAMVKNIILSFGGSISFESEVGKGTVFSIILPKYEFMHKEEQNEQDQEV
jgi:signal transduction histidine kinase